MNIGNLIKISGMKVKYCLIPVIVLFIAFWSPLLHAQPPSKTLPREVKVIKVHDGDTITLMINGKMRKSRLIGIDAPEMNQRPWGRRSKEHLIDLLNHADWIVMMETDVVETDKYSRSLVYLWTKNSEFINEQMIRDGYAVLFTIKPNSLYADLFKKAQLHAREGGKGIWGPNGLKEKPIEYKKKHPRNQ